MKKILILVDNSRRDLLGVKFLERCLIENGKAEVRLCHKRNVNIALRDYMPDAFIVSRADYPYVKSLKGLCRIYLVPGEGGRLSPESALGPFLGRAYTPDRIHDVSFIDRAYLWGKRVKSWLVETELFKEEQFFISGNNRMDIYREHQKQERDAKKPFIIGFAFSAKTTSAYYGAPHYPEVYYHMLEGDRYPVLQDNCFFEEYLWRDHAFLRLSMEVLKRILKETEAHVSFRIGPFEDVSEYDFLKKTHPGRIRVESQSELLPEWLGKVDVMVTCWSTAGLDALVLDKPVIALSGMLDQQRLFNAFRPRENGFEDFVPCYYTPGTHAEIMELLHLAERFELSATPDLDRFTAFMSDIYDWYPDKEKSATRLIVEDILNDIESRPLPHTSRAKWNKQVPSRTVDFFNRFMPTILAIKMSHVAIYIWFWVSDLRSGTYSGNRSHYHIKSKPVSRLVKQANL
jgi:surface carbohydrate biosynthesis protein